MLSGPALVAELRSRNGLVAAALAQRAALGDRAADAAAQATIDARHRLGLPAAPRATVPAALAASVAAIAGKAAAPRVDNAKIHAADLPRKLPAASRPDLDSLLQRARRAAAGRAKGDPLHGTLLQIAQTLAYQVRRQGSGYAVASLAQLAGGAGCCVDTARKAIRWLERAALIDTVNTMRRGVVGGVNRLLRGANLYLIRPAVPASASPAEPATGPAHGGAAGTLARWGSVLGLSPRRTGFNVAPLRPSGG